jgi:phosphoribosyl 1,2-cyclic phosphodiesterase
MVLLESNHDPDMLRANPNYNAVLKARILGDRGHLSNAACAEALLQLIASGTRHVILGHLSAENNTPTLARKVSRGALEREGIRDGEDVRLQVALRDEVGSVFILKERA